MFNESNLITSSNEAPTMAEIETRLREQAEKEIERQKDIFVKKLAEQKARLDEQQKQLEQVLAGFTTQPTPLAVPTGIPASVKPPTAYHTHMPIVQVLQRDPSIDSGIPDIYTTEEVKMFRDNGHTDDQIERLGRRKLAQKANRAKKREGEDVIEIRDKEGEKTERPEKDEDM
uniref:Uncharacterized protein n=1 Tax=Romanomermis culicivorax TaxID=13658 RepID=A0A915K0V4_ROMCU